METKEQQGFEPLLAKAAEEYLDPANRKMRILKDSESQKLADRFHVSMHDVYIEALSRGIWPYRYVRNQNGFSISDQLRLAESRVGVIGSGGLGGTLILLLARIGIGSLVIIDHDVFDETNLNRQAISSVNSVGTSKSKESGRMVKSINPAVNVTAHQLKVGSTNGADLLAGCDVLVDALDNIHDRLVLVEIARGMGIPYVHGAIAGFYGQVMTVFPEDTSFKEIYGADYPQEVDSGTPEAVLGVPAVTPSIISSLQSMEVIKVILNRGRVLRNCILQVNLEESQFNEFILE